MGASKIQYAISYLSGSALQYFEPAILSEIIPEPAWVWNWDSFKSELKLNFGPFNNATQAKINLEKIVMKEHHKVSRYFIEFSQALNGMTWHSDTSLTRPH